MTDYQRFIQRVRLYKGAERKRDKEVGRGSGLKALTVRVETCISGSNLKDGGN